MKLLIYSHFFASRERPRCKGYRDGPERPYLEKQIAASQLEFCVRITGFFRGEHCSANLAM